MGVTKQTLIPGNGQDYPARGSVVTIHYTGTLYDPSKTDDHCKGDQFDTSSARGPLNMPIGVGRVIRGWDEGVPQMTLGERAILTITSGYGYGDTTNNHSGFPGLIPPGSDLVFDVHLIGIDSKTI